MAVGHDQDEGARRRVGKRVGRIVEPAQRDVRRDDRPGTHRPRIDPGDGEGQRRQRQHQRPADMAGAEQDQRPAVVAEAFA